MSCGGILDRTNVEASEGDMWEFPRHVRHPVRITDIIILAGNFYLNRYLPLPGACTKV
jgi:hypothetical protein